jgi:hypothetical protein
MTDEMMLYLPPPNLHNNNTTTTPKKIHENSVTNIEIYHRKFAGALKTVRSDSKKNKIININRSMKSFLF